MLPLDQGMLAAVSREPSRWFDPVSEVYASVREEAPLHEFPLGAVDDLGAGRTVVHGPWSAEECQSILIPWLKAGWIELTTDVEPPWSLTSAEWRLRATQQGEFLVLSADDAAKLLNEPERWVLGTADGHAMLSPTHQGQAHGYAEWLELARKASEDRAAVLRRRQMRARTHRPRRQRGLSRGRNLWMTVVGVT